LRHEPEHEDRARDVDGQQPDLACGEDKQPVSTKSRGAVITAQTAKRRSVDVVPRFSAATLG
jgi:hypothetical protein